MAQDEGSGAHEDRGDWREEYWRRNLRLMVILLSVWALVSYGFSIVLVEPFNNFVINGFPMGFWWAQNGSEITFVILIAIYVRKMESMDEEYGIAETGQEEQQA
ncbi:MAG: DUF4212 domain-containing protein [Actinomycetota bacterium]|nr:DUF4212 domain-containing protein [Actinomycetota bacterium]